MKNIEEEDKTNFAENLLKKYGWKEGEGIGKTNKGIAIPIKASLKFNNTGVGYNLSEQFTTNWWDHLYNSAAKKVDKEESKSDDETSKAQVASSKGYLNRKDYFYSRFQKGSTLVDGRNQKTEEPVKNEEPIETEPKPLRKIVSDAELYKMCEGRTAHKGARHGIKMNGKLNRVEEQEKLLLEQMQQRLDEKRKAKSNESVKKKQKSSE